MKRSIDRILTTHVGSLPRPDDLVELYRDNAPLKDMADLLIKVKAQAYVIEAANVRHEHEWKVWKTTKLPQSKLLIPGIVSRGPPL